MKARDALLAFLFSALLDQYVTPALNSSTSCTNTRLHHLLLFPPPPLFTECNALQRSPRQRPFLFPPPRLCYRQSRFCSFPSLSVAAQPNTSPETLTLLLQALRWAGRVQLHPQPLQAAAMTSTTGACSCFPHCSVAAHQRFCSGWNRNAVSHLLQIRRRRERGRGPYGCRHHAPRLSRRLECDT